ncbi:SixA phosphatase family protein [Stakelama tenebrarum]|uniref:Histidine phosphatase family protein n=1 Tax=Stakelama tenebrarum TaxID=2711215 RepID=A0A6G6Y104_9SPHN|nr:histidine phosphatase family protein [Sphingosinithalassobacter tenebrarum]QIG78511.1 histidine phosphatase family protein [Sphingosinithalassobacter tenebrarum]
MKTLTLLRHAKSGWDDSVARDFDRPLNPKGHRAALAMGRHMRSLGLAFDHVVASPAVRVTETLSEIESGFGTALAPDWEKRLYLASAATLLDMLQELPDSVSNILFVGHNPGLEELVLLLVPGGSDLRSDVEEKFPTASLAQISFDTDRWSEIEEGKGVLKRFVRPRDLDPALGPDR